MSSAPERKIPPFENPAQAPEAAPATEAPQKLRVNWTEDDTVHVRSRVEALDVDEAVSRSVSYGEVSHEEPEEEDDGLVHELPDGSISIPVLEEQIVVTKRTVVRERIVVRRRTEAEVVHVRDRLHQDDIEVEANDNYEVTRMPGKGKPFPLSSADPNRKPPARKAQ